MKMDVRGSFVRGDTASVQSAEGRDRIVKIVSLFLLRSLLYT